MKPRGERIGGRYALGRALGAGRGGHVFEAIDTKTERRVALKLREPTSGLELDIERAGLRSIEHPHLLRILDAGDHDGRSFVVTELAEHGSLADRSHPLALAEMSLLASQILEGLAFLHAQGILHGDVKTENILVTSLDPLVFKLGDFGLAQRSVDVTSGTTLGSPAFMPPEIIRGDPADERSDLYSLGVTLYEAAFAELPFDDEDVRTVLMRHLTEVPRRLQVPGGTDPKLFALLRRLLAKEPAERPVDARGALALWRGDEAAAPRWIPPRLGVLIGRDQELAQLEKALEGAQAVASIEGPPGIGKTRLLNEFALRAELRGTPTHWWTPDGLTSTEPEFDTRNTIDPPEIAEGSTLRDFALSRASSVFESIRSERYIVFIDDVDHYPEWFQESLSLVIREAAARNKPGRLVCVSGQSRAENLVVEALEAGGYSQGLSIRLTPWPQQRIQEATQALLGARRIDATFLQQLEAASGGIPAELEALCLAVVDQSLLRLNGSGSLAIEAGFPLDAVVALANNRTNQLLVRCSNSELQVLQTMSLLRVPATQDFLQSASSAGATDLHSLQRTGLITVVPGSSRLRLMHERLKRATLATLNSKKRRALHDRIAQALVEQPGMAPQEDLLLHRCLGSDLTIALASLDHLRRRSQAGIHSNLLRAACESVLDLWPADCDLQQRASIELQLLDILLCMGDYRAIERLVEDLRFQRRFASRHEALVCRLSTAFLEMGDSTRAISALDTLGQSEKTAHARLLHARACFMQRRHAEALTICDGLAAPHGEDSDFPVEVLELQASCKRALGNIAEAEHLLDQAIAFQDSGLSPRRLSSLLANRGLIHFYQGRMNEAETCFQQSLELSQSAGDRYGMARILNSLAATAGEMGHYPESAERLRTALDLCRRLGETETASSILANLGQLLMLQGTYSDALARAREACDLARRRNLRSIFLQNTILLGGILAMIGLEEGCHRELEAVLEESRGSVQEGQILLLWSGLALERGQLDPTSSWLARAASLFQSASAKDEIVLHDLLKSRLLYQIGEFDSALDLARRTVSNASRLRLLSADLDSRIWLSELVLQNSPEEAQLLAAGVLAESRRVGLPEAMWRSGAMLGRIEASTGSYGKALSQYEEALRVLYEIAAKLPDEMMDQYVARPERARLFNEVRELKLRVRSTQ